MIIGTYRLKILFAHLWANAFSCYRMMRTMHKPWYGGLEIWKVCSFHQDNGDHDVWCEEHITQKTKEFLHISGKKVR
jgi:hypothetical protein